MNDHEPETTYTPAFLTIPEIKACARENMLGKYAVIVLGTVLIAVVQSILSTVFSNNITTENGVFSYLIYYVAMFLISMLYIFFEAGIKSMHLKASRNQTFQIDELLFAVKHSSNRFLTAAMLLTAVSFVWQIPFHLLMNYGIDAVLNQITALGLMDFGTVSLPDQQVILLTAGITVIGAAVCLFLTLSFSLVIYLLIDNPDLSAPESFSISWNVMKGERKRLFLLYLSFIGLYLLGMLSLGIGTFWIVPYLDQSVTVFYKDVVIRHRGL